MALLGEPEEALGRIRQARREAEGLGSQWRLLPILIDEARLLESAADRTSLDETLEKARALLADLSMSLPPGQDLAAFQALPELRGLL
jgi:hypothetical protein